MDNPQGNTASDVRASTAQDGKFVTPCALPSEREREILTILIEECAEVQQRATKLLRFGRDECQPGQDFSNAYRLGMEIGDLNVMVEMAVEAGLIRDTSIWVGENQKRKQLAKYMQTTGATDTHRDSVNEQRAGREDS